MLLSWQILVLASAFAAAPLPVGPKKPPCPWSSVRTGAPPYVAPAPDPVGAGYGTDIELPKGTIASILPKLREYFDWETAVKESMAFDSSNPFKTLPPAYLHKWIPEHRDQLPANFDSLDPAAKGRAIVAAGLLGTLPDNVISTLIIGSATTKPDLVLGVPQRLRLREGAPEVLKRWMWHRDGDALEFAFEGISPAWAEARGHYGDFARTLGIEKSLFNEEGPGMPVHLHFSRAEPIPVDAVRGMQWVVLLDAAGRGTKSLTDTLATRYTSIVANPENDERGVVRQPGGDSKRVEVRMVIPSVDETSNTFRGFLATSGDPALRESIAAHLMEQLNRLGVDGRKEALSIIGEKAPFTLTDLYVALHEKKEAEPLVQEVLKKISEGVKLDRRWEDAVARTWEQPHWTDENRIEFLGRLHGVDSWDAGQLTRVLRSAGFDERVHRVAQVLDQARVVVGGGGGDARVISARTEEERVELEGQLATARRIRDFGKVPEKNQKSEAEEWLRNLRQQFGIPD